MPRTSRAADVYRERISKVVDYISANLAAPHSLADLARRSHFSPFHFHRVFKSVMGEPVAECVFVFLGSERAEERPVSDLATAMREVRAALAACGAAATTPSLPRSGR